MKLQGRRTSSNIQAIYGARERRHQTNRAVKDWAIDILSPRKVDTTLAKKLKTGYPNPSSLKKSRLGGKKLNRGQK